MHRNYQNAWARAQRIKAYATATRQDFYGWLHDDGQNETGVPIPCRNRGGYTISVGIGLNSQDHTVERVRGYLLKYTGERSIINGAGEGQSERSHFEDRRNWMMRAAKRPGAPLGIKNMFDFVWRFLTVNLRLMAPLLSFLQGLRFCLIAPASIRGVATSELVRDSNNTNNEAACAIMWAWSWAPDQDLASVITVTDTAYLYLRCLKNERLLLQSFIDGEFGRDRQLHNKAAFKHIIGDTDFDCCSFDEVSHLNDNMQAQAGVNGDPRGNDASLYSDTPITYDYLRGLLTDERALRLGDQRNYPGSIVDVVNPADGAAAAAAHEQHSLAPRTLDLDEPDGPSHLPFKQQFVDQCQEWKSQYAKDLHRYRFLVIAGPSMAGKSMFAQFALGFKRPYICASDFDMRQFKHNYHDVIILNDTPNLVAIITRYKEFFQCNNTLTNLCGSNTNMYAFQTSTYKTPIIVTTNLDAEFNKLKNCPWIVANSHILIANDPLFEGADEENPAENSRRMAWANALMTANDQPVTRTVTRKVTTIVHSGQTTPLPQQARHFAVAQPVTPGSQPVATVTASLLPVPSRDRHAEDRIGLQLAMAESISTPTHTPTKPITSLTTPAKKPVTVDTTSPGVFPVPSHVRVSERQKRKREKEITTSIASSMFEDNKAGSDDDDDDNEESSPSTGIFD